MTSCTLPLHASFTSRALDGALQILRFYGYVCIHSGTYVMATKVHQRNPNHHAKNYASGDDLSSSLLTSLPFRS